MKAVSKSFRAEDEERPIADEDANFVERRVVAGEGDCWTFLRSSVHYNNHKQKGVARLRTD